MSNNENLIPRIEESAFKNFDNLAEKAYKIKSIDAEMSVKSLDETCYSSSSIGCSEKRQKKTVKINSCGPQVFKIKSLNPETNRDKSEYECRFEHNNG